MVADGFKLSAKIRVRYAYICVKKIFMKHLINKRWQLKIVLLLALGASIFILAGQNYENIFLQSNINEPSGSFSFYSSPRAHPEARRAEGSKGKGVNLPSVINKEISLDLDFLNNGRIFSKLKIDNLNTKKGALSGDIIVTGRILKNKRGERVYFLGKLISNNLMLGNAKLVNPKMLFKLTKDELRVYSLNFGKPYRLRGIVRLIEPFETELYFEILRANIRDIALILKVKNPDVVVGMMNGMLKIKGPLYNLSSGGIIESKNGRVGPVRYNFASVKLEGFGPIINIADSNIKQGDGTLNIEGYIDLRNVIKPNSNIFEGLRVKSDMKIVSWNGWDITKSGSDGLNMSKDVASDLRVGFKTVAREPRPTYYNKENPEELSLEYKLGERESFDMKLKENGEFIGIKHKTKF